MKRTVFTTSIITCIIFSTMLFYSCSKQNSSTNTANTNPYGNNMGMASFYHPNSLGDHFDLSINNSNVGEISHYGNINCGYSSDVNEKLAPGTYSWKAVGQGNGGTYSGSFSVTSGNCQLINIENGTHTSGTGGTITCSSSLKAYGTIMTLTGAKGVWTNWYKVADIGNGAVYISFKFTECLGGGLGVSGWPKYRIQNTCTSLPNCHLDFKFEYEDCDGISSTASLFSLPLNQSYIDEDPGYWFLGIKVNQSFIASSVKVY